MPSLKQRLDELDRLRKQGVISDSEHDARRAAIMSASDAPADSGRGGSILRWGALGCVAFLAALGAIAAIVVMILLLAAGSKDDFEDARVEFRDDSSGSVETARHVQVRVAIDKITDPAISTSQFDQPAPGNHFLTVAVTIENVGERETAGGQFHLRTTDGFEYGPVLAPGAGASDGNAYQKLTSGGRTSAVLAFEVRDGWQVEWLKFDPNALAKGDLYFDNVTSE